MQLEVCSLQTDLHECFSALFVQLENCQECLGWNLNGPQRAHLFLTLLLLFQQLLLTGNIAAVALGQHILTQSLDGFPAMILPPMAA